MGITDKIFRGRKKNLEPTQEELDKQFGVLKEKLETSLASQSENIDKHLDDIDHRINQLNQSPTTKNIARIVQEEARKSQLEIDKLQFSKTHATVENFRKEFLAQQIRKNIGITASKPQSPYMQKLEALHSSGLIDKRYLDKLFLPYLIEKKALGIISKEEQQELNVILGATGKLEDIENATTQESYTSDFNNALIILGAIGVIKLEEFAPCKEFPKGREIRDFSLMGNLEIYAEASNLANKINIQLKHSAGSKKQLTPSDFFASALSQTSMDKTNEAKSIENSKLNLEKGETKDGK